MPKIKSKPEQNRLFQITKVEQFPSHEYNLGLLNYNSRQRNVNNPKNLVDLKPLVVSKFRAIFNSDESCPH